ncbi:MAG: long-chain fatty acid--CoA ligase [Alphaproteobacteria bacterium]|nr:MAG: long-chain fatty acid--CoA ligase [Alphaproteobacteria bacterium]
MVATQLLDREALRRKSAPLLLCERTHTAPEGIAFRSKHLGLYRERTWREYAALVARAARAFAALGLRRGDRVAIMGDACEEWVISDLAAQSLGAIVYGIYPTASASEVEYQMRDGGAVLFIAENQEYLDKLLPLADRLPALNWIVVIDDTATFAYQHPKLRAYRALLAAAGEPDLAWLEEQAARLDADAPAFIVYTSGTTGAPKGALVTHGKHLAAAANIVDHYPTLAQKEHRTVGYLPLCHVLGRDVAVTLPLISRLVPHFGEHAEDLPTTLFETAPTVLFTVPRYLQRFAAQVLLGIRNSGGVKRASAEIAMQFARAHARRRWNGAGGFAERALYRACRAGVFLPLLNKLGFDRLELVVCAGAPLPPQTMALWQMFGINVVEMYGQTETAGGIICGQRGPFPRPGDVGAVPAGWQVKLASDGEVLVKSPDLFESYWNNPDATRAVKNEDGWLRTGDIGEWHAGALRLVDRARDFIVTSGGKTVSPSFVENILRASPYIAEAIVFGHGRKYLAALIEIEADTVADWARSHDVAYTGFTSLAGNPEVAQLIGIEVERANGELSRPEQIKAFRILPKALDPEEEGEPITPTRKVKRHLMYERFKTLVEEMYDDREQQLIAAGAVEIA